MDVQVETSIVYTVNVYTFYAVVCVFLVQVEYVSS